MIVRLGERTLTTREVLALVPGSIIELPKNADEPLDLMVNNRQIGVGTAVKIGENFGIRIIGIGGVRERIEAMGGVESGDGPGDESGGQDEDPDSLEPANSALSEPA